MFALSVLANAAWDSIWDVLLYMLVFFLFMAWLVLLFQVFNDIFRRDMSGWAKAIWSIAIIVFPLLGTLVYLIANGSGMTRRDVRDAEASDAVTRAYIRDAAGTGGPADQLSALQKMHEAGQLNDDEYAKAKAKVVG